MTIKLECLCSHPFQGRLYGKLRIHNEMKKEHNWRCTVCGTVRTYGEEKKK